MIDFDWIIDGKLAASSKPDSIEDILKWRNIGFKAVLVLIEDIELIYLGGLKNYLKILKKNGFKTLSIPIRDFHTPTFEEALKAVKWIEEMISKNNPVIVHCNAGLGRTGTIVACYLVYKEKMNPGDAINYVAERRPGSLEIYGQVRFVYKFKEYLDRIM